MKNPPSLLRKDLIIEAIFEIRFDGKTPALSDVLAGLIYSKFKKEFPKMERLPFSNLPSQLIESDPNLRFQPRNRMMGDQFAILIGDHSTIVSCRKPYVGWRKFSPLIFNVVNSLRQTELIASVERFAVKYVNLIQEKDLKTQFSAVNLEAQMGKYGLTDHLTMFRTEIEDKGFTNIVEIVPNSNLQMLTGERLTGLLLTIDTIHKNPSKFWDDSEKLINAAHDTEKNFFFEILSENALKKCDPVWE